MTEINDAEVAEILWASSEQGKAAVKAAWDEAVRRHVTEADGPAGVGLLEIGAIVYAAHLAAERTVPHA